MPAVSRDVPPDLIGRPVTTADANAAGVTSDMLGRRWTRLFRGVWWWGERPRSLTVWLAAARLLLPQGVVVSHVTALRLLGVEVGELLPLHLSHAGRAQTGHATIRLHRRRVASVHVVDGVACVSPEQAFLDSASIVSLRELVRAGDALVRRHLTTPERLIELCRASSARGVVRATRAAALVRERVDSFRETDLRLLLHCAGLPIPACNVKIYDASGFIARSDLVYPMLKIVLEYDGWHHERSAAQRRKDLRRRERLEAAGWLVIVVVSGDLDDPLGLVRRVHRALVSRGFDRQAPDPASTWAVWRQMDAV